MQKLQFVPAQDAGDQGKQLITKQKLEKIKENYQN